MKAEEIRPFLEKLLVDGFCTVQTAAPKIVKEEISRYKNENPKYKKGKLSFKSKFSHLTGDPEPVEIYNLDIFLHGVKA